MNDITKQLEELAQQQDEAGDIVVPAHIGLRAILEYVRGLEGDRDSLRSFHDNSVKRAYELLGIDGSDGEYRMQWVILEIGKLIAERDSLTARNAELEAEVGRLGGVGLIAAERVRQVSVEGWTPEHDDAHDKGELVYAAVTYAQPWRRNGSECHDTWPWDEAWWKPSNDPIRNLVKAGALIAAEIDRLQRAALTASKPENDDREHCGKCENCGAKIYDGDKYWVDSESVYLCHKCMPAKGEVQ